jgi:MFS superfamily sulfate permease-like transporter
MVLLFASRVLESFPRAALGAIVVYAAVALIDLPEFRRLIRFRYTEALLALAAVVGVLMTDILVGVVVAVALSAIDTIHRIARPHDAVLGRVPGVAGLHDVDDYPSAQTVPGLLVYRYDAPLFFANAEDFKTRALASLDAEERRRPVEWFLLNAEANVGIDITAADALESLRATLAERGVVFAMARVKQDLLEELDAAGLVTRIGRDHIFPTLPTALEAFERRGGG